MSSIKIKNILLVEDLCDVRQWLAENIEAALPHAHIVEAASYRQAAQLLETYEPDCAFIDLGLQDRNGVSLIPLIKLKSKHCPCVVLSIYEDHHSVFSALKAGADGYLIKTQSENELKQAINSLIEGHSPLSPCVSRMMLEHFRHLDELQSVHLTQREEEVLILIANGYSARKAAECLDLSIHTVNDYIKALYTKLQVNNRAEATLKAIHIGLINP